MFEFLSFWDGEIMHHDCKVVCQQVHFIDGVFFPCLLGGCFDRLCSDGVFFDAKYQKVRPRY